MSEDDNILAEHGLVDIFYCQALPSSGGEIPDLHRSQADVIIRRPSRFFKQQPIYWLTIP
jgi:hypothetical protein